MTNMTREQAAASKMVSELEGAQGDGLSDLPNDALGATHPNVGAFAGSSRRFDACQKCPRDTRQK